MIMTRNFKVRPHSTLALVLAMNAASALAADQTLELSKVESWQCSQQLREGRSFANEMVSFLGHDCPAFLANHKQIFDPLQSSASFTTENVSQLCYLEGFRSELELISERMVKTCPAQVRSSLQAGMVLGRVACRLTPEGELTPELALGRVEGSYFDANGQHVHLKLVVPVRSDAWSNQLSRSQESGFQVGCILGERDFINGLPQPYQDAAGNMDWRAAGEDVGRAFALAYCPVESGRVTTLMTTLAGAHRPDAAAQARLGFDQAFKAGCNR